MHIKNLILGGGVVGLICSMIIEDSKVVDKNIGGQMLSNFGPRYLYDTIHTRALLNLLDYEIKTKRIFSAYCLIKDCTVELRNHATDDVRKSYWKKTRPDSLFKESAMSSGILEYNVLDIDFSNLIRSMISFIERKNKHNDLFKSFAIKINVLDKYVVLENNEIVYYENLITTLPATLFYNICGAEIYSRKFKSYNKVFVKSNSDKYEHLINNMFDYIYYPGEELYHRSTKQENSIIFEFSNVKKEDAISSIIEGELVSELKFGQVGDGNIIDLSSLSIYQIGRYAEWNHSIKTERALSKIISLEEKLNGI